MIDHAALTQFTLNVTGLMSLGSIPAYYHFEKKLGPTYAISKDHDDSILGMRRALTKELSDLLGLILILGIVAVLVVFIVIFDWQRVTNARRAMRLRTEYETL